MVIRGKTEGKAGGLGGVVKLSKVGSGARTSTIPRTRTAPAVSFHHHDTPNTRKKARGDFIEKKKIEIV